MIPTIFDLDARTCFPFRVPTKSCETHNDLDMVKGCGETGQGK
jgi:hypothetical protein